MRGLVTSILCLTLSSAAYAEQPASVGSKNTESAQSMEKNTETDLSNLTLAQMELLLGKPAKMAEFTLSMNVTEFRIELLNFYSKEMLLENPPLIVEATWALSPEKNKTIWFRPTGDGLKYLHHADWDVGVEF